MTTASYTRAADERVNWVKSIPFLTVHLLPLGLIFTGVRLVDWVVCLALYYGRMFFVTAGYHRYFSHRGYKVSRPVQFLMALGGTTAVQKGPLWWAAHHRHHHRFSDTEDDIHSPMRGFWWSHVGWILCDKYTATDLDAIKDFGRYPELRWLDRYWLVPPIVLGALLFLAGGTSMLLCGFFLSTVLLWHGTYTINSITHLWGRRRFVTLDTSRNSFLLAVITLGEGWHNNHHYWAPTANNGFFWWELDPTYYVIRAMGLLRLATDIRTPPAEVLARNRVKDGNFDIGMFHAYWGKAAAALSNARAHAGELAGARKRAVEELADSARATADRLSSMVPAPPNPATD
ncbi:MAG: acyl-CoA desaturase [Acidimicrobiia bacterium]